MKKILLSLPIILTSTFAPLPAFALLTDLSQDKQSPKPPVELDCDGPSAEYIRGTLTDKENPGLILDVEFEENPQNRDSMRGGLSLLNGDDLSPPQILEATKRYKQVLGRLLSYAELSCKEDATRRNVLPLGSPSGALELTP
jgi:hypothetical protein